MWVQALVDTKSHDYWTEAWAKFSQACLRARKLRCSLRWAKTLKKRALSGQLQCCGVLYYVYLECYTSLVKTNVHRCWLCVRGSVLAGFLVVSSSGCFPCVCACVCVYVKLRAFPLSISLPIDYVMPCESERGNSGLPLTSLQRPF